MDIERKKSIIKHYKKWMVELRSIHDRWLSSGMDYNFHGDVMDADLDIVCNSLEHKIDLKVLELEEEIKNEESI